MVVTAQFFSSVEEFQALAMSLAAKVFLPGTGWVAFKQLMDLVGLLAPVNFEAQSSFLWNRWHPQFQI